MGRPSAYNFLFLILYLIKFVCTSCSQHLCFVGRVNMYISQYMVQNSCHDMSYGLISKKLVLHRGLWQLRFHLALS